MAELKTTILNLTIAVFILAEVYVANGDRIRIEAADLGRIAEFDDVRVKLNSLFDSFDDVITAQNVRVSNGVADVDDDFNEKLVELVEEAEDLDDRIGGAIRGKRKIDLEKEEEEEGNSVDLDVLNKMKTSATFMVKRASSLLDDVIKWTGSSDEDTTLIKKMEKLAERVKDVLWAMKAVETKRKVKGWKKETSRKKSRHDDIENQYSIRDAIAHYTYWSKEESEQDDTDSDFDYNIQKDDANSYRPSSFSNKDHLRGTPVSGHPRRSSYTSGSQNQNETKANVLTSYHNAQSRRTLESSRRNQYKDLNERYRYRQTDSRRRRPWESTRRLGNIRESSTTRNHYLDLMGLGEYLRTCSDCAGLTERTTCPMVNEMTELKKWSSELQQLLSYGCAKPKACKVSGICCVNRKAQFREAIVKMTQMMKDVHNMLDKECQEECQKDSCQRDPEWMDWSSWSSCDVSCGQGTMQRRRTCNDTNSNGKSCPGNSVSVLSCRGPDCCVDGQWAGWTGWAACSASCGRGVQERSRRCDGANTCGRPCEGRARERRACRGIRDCCVDGNWSGWARWATCSATCGQGITYRRRKCDAPERNDCGKTCPGLGEERRRCGDDKECCVDGNWSSWAGWTSCSVSCGLGASSRIRRCDRPSPNFCGQRCPGAARDTKTCNAGQCCVNGNWGRWAAWEGCSVSCGRGSELRRRRCDSPTPNSCGESCPGQPSELRSCQKSSCCVNGNWGQWAPWEGCSASCGRGNQLRRRQCDSPSASSCGDTCPGRPTELRACQNTACCVNGNWGQWAPWEGCSASCGRGNQLRRRQCDSPSASSCGDPCPGRPTELRACQNNACCVNGNWGQWAPWEGCSASCGRGSQLRRRRCDSPSASSCGDPCPGRSTDMKTCQRAECCVNGNWADWSDWSRCPVTCGQGSQLRSRVCSNPPPNSCGRSCPGPNQQDKSCRLAACPPACRDGNWSRWSPWGACSKSCGGGRRVKTRTCNNPSPNSCGQKCPGRSEARERCNERECCVDGNWGSWQRWTGCSVSCGLGQRSRGRLCNDPSPGTCGRRCSGESIQTGVCDTQRPCCVDGNWASWQRWTPCSVSCGIGRRSRGRTCSNPQPNSCGRVCVGEPVDTTSCDTRVPCFTCVNGNWGSWQRWTQCSVSCGLGQRSRGRLCDDPPANRCGKPCVGDSIDTGMCDTKRSCCVDGNWASWQRWSPCSVTCGTGQRSRGRACNEPKANYCGKTCPGPAVDRDTCYSGRQCITCVNGNWGAWQEWAACSVSCGKGDRARARLCNNPPPNVCGRKCVGEPVDKMVCDPPCCVNGNWGAWQEWAACSVSCGKGDRARARLCNNPPPNVCGRKCVGEPVDKMVCDPPCCVNGNWGAWQEWAACSVSCGKGDRARARLCNNPPPNMCGRKCVGEPVDKMVCDPPCCVDGNWGSWQRWTPCSVTCGVGHRSRGRACNDPPANFCGKTCPGSTVDRGSCDSGRQCITCVDGNWSEWAGWSPCSASCGYGYKNRQRTCDDPAPNFCGKACSGSGSDVDSCNSGKSCCVDGNWSNWAQWSDCSATCGSGFKERLRSCDNPLPNTCGKKCSGSTTEKTWCSQRVCISTTTTVATTPMRCEDLVRWSNWSPWSSCSVSCDGGVIKRVRECMNLMPNRCRTQCSGRASEERPCQSGVPCCRDGNWSPWSPFSGCSTSCGTGSKRRSRACNDPPPNYCGKTCSGDKTMSVPCATAPCPETTTKPISGHEGLSGKRDCGEVQWSAWSPWDSCSVTCDTGVKERVRDCENPYPDACKNTCPGEDTDTAPCPTGISCCGNVEWNKWSKWTRCSATCGSGLRERARTCNNPQPRNCPSNKYCRGDEKQVKNCNSKQDCCVDGDWGAWNSWSLCSASCGRGSKERRRRCDSPPANYCGRKCVGREYDTETCEANIPCPLVCDERNWSEWTSWTACSTTCGSSVVQRSRMCDPETQRSCKYSCQGDNTDSKLVACGPEPIDGNWSSWNDWTCRGVCTQGLKFKTRTCNNPSPNSCGTPCPGRDTEVCDPDLCTKECAMRQWTTWGSWASCSRTCGQGSVRRREMMCEFVGGLQGKMDCGRESWQGCRGERMDDEPCRGLPMCIGDTTWGEWSSCSATCRGNGVRTRRMMVMQLSGLFEQRGGDVETKFCSVQYPECFAPWGPWGPCSATCRGQGTRERRTIIDLTDLGSIHGTIQANATQIETQNCNVESPECASWGPWGPCSATCRGEGVRQRRTITVTDIVDGGTIEASASQTETEVCYASIGPDCDSWGQWGACSATCKGPGVRERRLGGRFEDESRRPVETKACFGTGPACAGVLWGEWGACSATCKGQGVRIRETISRTYLSDGREVEATATQTETKVCAVSGPDCPPGPTWGTWESWCPCGCSDGKRSRRRECVQSGFGGQRDVVDVSLCRGEGRQEERCETRGICPECIESCTGKQDGKYPACSGCRYHLTCVSGQLKNGVIEQCRETDAWDGFIHKCVTAPSPSCSLKDCVTDCRNKKDGFYHMCAGCSWYVECISGVKRDVSCGSGNMEFNQFTGKCGFQRSPTCKRNVDGFGIVKEGKDDDPKDPLGVVIGDAWQKDPPKNNANSFVSGSGSSSSSSSHGQGQGQHGGGGGGGGDFSVHVGGGGGGGGTTFNQGSNSFNQGGGGTTFVQGGGRGGGTTFVQGGGRGGGTTFVQGGGRGGTTFVQGGGGGSGTSFSVHGGRGGSGSSTFNQGGGGTTFIQGGGGGGRRVVVVDGGAGAGAGGGGGGGGGVSVSRRVEWSGGNPIVIGGSQPSSSSHSSSSSSHSSSSSFQGGHIGTGAGTSHGGSGHQSPRGCISTCKGSRPGRYASCDGCPFYIVCTSTGKEKKRRCFGTKFWDDVIKRCVNQSSTCKQRT